MSLLEFSNDVGLFLPSSILFGFPQNDSKLTDEEIYKVLRFVCQAAKIEKNIVMAKPQIVMTFSKLVRFSHSPFSQFAFLSEGFDITYYCTHNITVMALTSFGTVAGISPGKVFPLTPIRQDILSPASGNLYYCIPNKKPVAQNQWKPFIMSHQQDLGNHQGMNI